MLNLASVETNWLFFTDLPLDINDNNIETDLKVLFVGFLLPKINYNYSSSKIQKLSQNA